MGTLTACFDIDQFIDEREKGLLEPMEALEQTYFRKEIAVETMYCKPCDNSRPRVRKDDRGRLICAACGEKVCVTPF